jgi:hypothetical protein
MGENRPVKIIETPGKTTGKATRKTTGKATRKVSRKLDVLRGMALCEPFGAKKP